MFKWFSFLFFFSSLSIDAWAQFIFPETFIMIPIDTNRKNAGVISGTFSSQTQKEVVNQFGLSSEFAHRFRNNNIFTIAENFSLLLNGDDVVVSGGYVFARFRPNISREIYPEYMLQYQWREARGLEHKVAATCNARYRFYRDEKITLAFAAGGIMEYEKWNFTAVPDKTLETITNTTPVDVYNLRLNGYISYDHEINSRVKLDIGAYLNFRPDPSLFRTRYGMHALCSFKITNNLEYRVNIRTMYEVQPVVPVTNLWYQFFNALVLNF
jgi:hypothetical protein